MADNPPRLTKSLRLFNDVFQSDIDEEALLARKKRTLPQDKKTWSTISDNILKQCKPSEFTKVCLKSLLLLQLYLLIDIVTISIKRVSTDLQRSYRR